MSRGRHLVWAALVAATVIAADQITKALVNDRLYFGEKVEVLGPLKLTLTYNDGVAFGLAGGGGLLVIVLGMVALIALGAFVAAAPQGHGTWLAGGLILGGAVGNLIDRIRLGHVTDFIMLPSFPTFNVADSAITVGVVVLAWILIRDGREQSEKGDEPAVDSVESEGGG